MQHLLGQSCHQILTNTNDNASGMSTSPDRAMQATGGVSDSNGSPDQQAESDARDSETCQFTRPHSSVSATKRLYVSHFLSGWNTRVFEFGAVLYLATLFPDSLFPLSIYALVRGTSAIFLSPAVGQYIDTGDRLQVVKLSIGKHLALFNILSERLKPDSCYSLPASSRRFVLSCILAFASPARLDY
jgi:hypothetical protein